MNGLKRFGERITSRDPDRQTTEIQIRILRGYARPRGACPSVMNRVSVLGGAEIEAIRLKSHRKGVRQPQR